MIMVGDGSMKVAFKTVSQEKWPKLCLLLLAGATLILMGTPSGAQNSGPVPQMESAPVGIISPSPDESLMPLSEPGPDMTAAEASVKAQEVDNSSLLAIAEAKKHLRDATILPEFLQTLFFTAWQHALLQEAKIGFNTRLPNPGEIGTAGEEGPPPEPGIREISLGGIAFENITSWTVWLNGVRITPDAIPEQVLDIKVSRAFIDLKWFDTYTNKIYPIRLRPHERFNLDSRIFLPGTGTL